MQIVAKYYNRGLMCKQGWFRLKKKQYTVTGGILYIRLFYPLINSTTNTEQKLVQESTSSHVILKYVIIVHHSWQ